MFRSNGNRTFTRRIYIGGPDSAFNLRLTDLNEDGAVDIVNNVSNELGLSALFNRHVPDGGPTTYCTPKTSSSGCQTRIVAGSPGFPTSGAADFTLAAVDVQAGMNGLVFASLSGAAAIPFVGGTLCMNPPLKRGPILNAGGTPGSCDGEYSTVVNDGSLIPMGLDAGPGGQAHYQYFFRDPPNGAGILGSALSDAIEVDFL